MEIIEPDGRYPALKYKDFRYLWLGQFISNAGTQMQIVALNWHIYILTGSPVALGIIGLSRFIPIAIFSLIGGNFADVHNRKRILFIAQIILAALSLILTATTFLNMVNPTIIYVVTILAAITISFDLPARQALIPNLVEKKHLANAMSLNVVMFQTAMMVGPAAAGFIIGYLGVGTIYALDAFSFAAVLISLLLLKNQGDPVGERSNVSIRAVIEGLIFVKSKTLIWSTMILDFFTTLFASATVLLPIFAVDILRVGPQGLGLLYAAPSIGAVSAGWTVAHLGKIRYQGIILLSSVVIFGLATIVFGLSKNFLLSLIALGFVGAGDSVSAIIRNTIRQLETPDYIRGRMSSINMIFFMGGPQLGEFEAGILAAALGAPLSVAIGGVGSLVIVGIVAYAIPAIRKYHGHDT